MKKVSQLLLIVIIFASCGTEGFTTKEIIQDFSTLPDSVIIAKYGEPNNSKWRVNNITISKIRFEDMNNTSFKNINLSGSELDKRTGFEGAVRRGAANIYSIKLEGKSEVVYNTLQKTLRVSLEQGEQEQ